MRRPTGGINAILQQTSGNGGFPEVLLRSTKAFNRRHLQFLQNSDSIKVVGDSKW